MMVDKFLDNTKEDLLQDWDFTRGSFTSSGILSPWYVTGISDAEDSFQISIQEIKGKGLTGYKPFLEFKITQKNYSVGILFEIQKYFKCGRINIDNRKTSTMKFVVTNNQDLINKVIPHFDKYSLITSKYLNYINFRSATYIMKDKLHYNLNGINMLKDIKSDMNKSRLFKDKYDFCWSKNIILEPEWIEGFIDGEGSFQCEMNLPINNLDIGYIDRKDSKNSVNFSLQIKQNNHDVAVLNAIKKFFQYGYLKPKYDIKNIEATLNAPRDTTALWIRNFEVVCRFIDQYPLYTVKRLDYLDWKRLISLKKINAHLTSEGLNIMKKIKSNMNTNRFT